MTLCSHGSVCVVVLVQKGFFAAWDTFVWAAELGAELLNVIVSLFLLYLVIIIEFLIKTGFWLMPFRVIHQP